MLTVYLTTLLCVATGANEIATVGDSVNEKTAALVNAQVCGESTQ